VTLAGLFCGALLVVAARTEASAVVLDRRWRTPLLVPVLALLALSFVGLVGNRAEASALAAAAHADWSTTAADADRASTWAPWSAVALELRAEVAGARHDAATARSLLRRAVQKDPSDRELWRRLAAVTSGKEHSHALERAVLLDPLGSR
jgi:Tetratricopeptide repeat